MENTRDDMNIHPTTARIVDAALSRLLLVSAVSLLGCVATSTDAPDEDVDHVAESVIVPAGVPYIGFGGYYNASSVAFTFDDGPDAVGITENILDTLRRKGVTATFFVNTDNACDLQHDVECQHALRRIVAEGHKLGNHTAHHADFDDLSVDVDSELRRVEDVVHAIAPTASISLTRAPYGHPFDSEGPQWRLNQIGRTVVRHGVHIGWSIDSNDWACTTSSCVRQNVLRQIDAGRRGIILLHAIYWRSANAVAGLIDAIRARGIRISTVESYVRTKYGASSYSLMMATR